MAKTLEERVRLLEDREGIRELRASYCFLVDDGRTEELVDRCFTEDAACEFRASGPGPPIFDARGREAIRPFFTKVVPGLLRDMSHTVHNHRIQIEDDEASGDCYFELTATEVATGREVVGAGRYVDRYRRTAQGWCFSGRRAEIFFMAPLSEGWEKRRFVSSLPVGPQGADPAASGREEG